MKEKRRHVRTSFSARVKVVHPDVGSVKCETRDVAQGGVFLCTDASELLNLEPGSEVTVQDDEILDDPPLVRATVVRIDSDGIALMFDEE